MYFSAMLITQGVPPVEGVKQQLTAVARLP